MSYHFGLGERAKERVDTHGHVMLTDEETRKLWHTSNRPISHQVWILGCRSLS